ncbi:MAG: AAA family ATPase, partial [Candidatus Omnitrophica bacterium]|nr:AAA family ATPase [Candidatus Omnitrophota bacterium]
MTKTIAIFSTKGGVGKTFIASNLAVALGQEEAKKILLLDLDLQVVGDMEKMLGLSPHRSMVDFSDALLGRSNLSPKEDFLIHTKLGIDFLPGVLKPQQAPHIDPDKIKDIFTLFKKDYDFIVVDAGKIINEVLLQVLNQANLILLVLTPDILAIYQTKWALDTLQSLHFPLSMVRIVLNRAASVSSISWQEIRVSLPVSIIAQVPSEGRIVGDAINRGIPVVIDSPKTKIAFSIKKLAHELVTEEDLFIEHREIEDLQLKEGLVDRPDEFWQRQELSEPSPEAGAAPEKIDNIVLLKRKINSRLIEGMNLKKLDLKVFSDPRKTKELRQKAESTVTNLLAEEAGTLIPSLEMRK